MKVFYAISKESISLMDNIAAQPMVNELKLIFLTNYCMDAILLKVN